MILCSHNRLRIAPRQSLRRRSLRPVKFSLVICLASVFCTPLISAQSTDAANRATVQRAFTQVLGAGGFRGYAQGHLFGAELPAMAGEIDVIFPDRIHARTDAMEFIALPTASFVNALGIWSEVDRSMLPVTAFDVAAMRQAIASIHDVRLEGSAKTSGCAADVYRLRAAGKLPGASANGDIRVWICRGSAQLSRLDATDSASGQHVVIDFDLTHRPEVHAPQL